MAGSRTTEVNREAAKSRDSDRTTRSDQLCYRAQYQYCQDRFCHCNLPLGDFQEQVACATWSSIWTMTYLLYCNDNYVTQAWYQTCLHSFFHSRTKYLIQTHVTVEAHNKLSRLKNHIKGRIGDDSVGKQLAVHVWGT